MLICLLGLRRWASGRGKVRCVGLGPILRRGLKGDRRERITSAPSHLARSVTLQSSSATSSNMSPTDADAVASSSRADPYADYPSTARSDWSTASDALKKRPRADSTTTSRRAQSSNQLIRTSDQPKTYSRLKQQVLTEEDYLTGLEDVIMRDFFPQLTTLTAQEDVRRAVDTGDDIQVEYSMRRMRDLCTPTPKRRAKGEHLARLSGVGLSREVNLSPGPPQP